MQITEYDGLIERLETPEGVNAAEVADEIKLDLLTDLMAAGDTYRPVTHRPSPPGSRYGGDE